MKSWEELLKMAHNLGITKVVPGTPVKIVTYRRSEIIIGIFIRWSGHNFSGWGDMCVYVIIPPSIPDGKDFCLPIDIEDIMSLEVL